MATGAQQGKIRFGRTAATVRKRKPAVPTPPRILHPYSRATAADMVKTLHGFRPQGFDRPLETGKPDASVALRAPIKQELGWSDRVPEYLEAIPVDNLDTFPPTRDTGG